MKIISATRNAKVKIRINTFANFKESLRNMINAIKMK